MDAVTKDGLAVLHYILALCFVSHGCIVPLPANGFLKAMKKGNDYHGPKNIPGRGLAQLVLWSDLAAQTAPRPVFTAHQKLLDTLGAAVRKAGTLKKKSRESVMAYAKGAFAEINTALANYRDLAKTTEATIRRGGDEKIDVDTTGYELVIQTAVGIYTGLVGFEQSPHLRQIFKGIMKYLKALETAATSGNLSSSLHSLQGNCFKSLKDYGDHEREEPGVLTYLAKAACVKDIILFNEDGSVAANNARIAQIDGSQSLLRAYPCLSTLVGDEHTKLLCVEEWCRARLRACNVVKTDKWAYGGGDDPTRMDFVAPMIALNYTGDYVKELFGFTPPKRVKKTKKRSTKSTERGGRAQSQLVEAAESVAVAAAGASDGEEVGEY
jgi:hypothetical protein